MIKKLLSLFKSDKLSTMNKGTRQASPPKRKVAPTRIGELGEHKINIQLDQLPKDCKYVSDIMIRNGKSSSGHSQIDHVVISRYGLFVIETKNYNGEIKGGRSDKYWRVSNRFNLYNPLLQNYGHIKAIENLLKEFPNATYISMVSFTMRCRFSIDPELRKIESDELVVYDTELSEYINRKLNRFRLTGQAELAESEITRIYESIQSANITDPAIRAEHIERAKLRSSK